MKNYIKILLLFTLLSCKSKPEVIQITESIDEFSFSKILTNEEKKGLLSMVSIPDTILSNETKIFLSDIKPLGVILFSYNVVNEKQLKKLCFDLKSLLGNDLLISIDQEGGGVTRIPWDPLAKISPYEIGKRNDYDYAYKIAYQRSLFLLDLGINVILGPVCDVPLSSKSYLYYRSFGTSVDVVSNMVEATVKAQKDAGIYTVLKHFPGHGKTTIDSHKDFAHINLELDYLMSTELKPFRKGIDSGAEFVMLGHIINQSIDSINPASLSTNYIDLLNSIGFNGGIMTDDLSMVPSINRTIGWGVNLISGNYNFILSRIKNIEPLDYWCSKIIDITKKNNGASHEKN